MNETNFTETHGIPTLRFEVFVTLPDTMSMNEKIKKLQDARREVDERFAAAMNEIATGALRL